MINKNDFIELQFLGKEKGGEIFDTNIKEEAKKINLEIEEKPFIICVGKEMVIKGLDKEIEGKEIGKKYSIELNSKQAFGDRKRDLVRLMSIKLFEDKKINIRQGMTLALDNYIVKIISVSGGRVLVDFNNPLAGKEVVYEFTIKRKVEDIKEKVNALIDFFIKQKLEFSVDETEKKIIFNIQEFYTPLIKIINDKFKDILKYEMAVEPKEEIKEKEKGNKRQIRISEIKKEEQKL